MDKGDWLLGTQKVKSAFFFGLSHQENPYFCSPFEDLPLGDSSLNRRVVRVNPKKIFSSLAQLVRASDC
jgi:hypothetical protein